MRNVAKVLTGNLVEELRSGRHYGVFIDDTGSRGYKIPGLHELRKSWVARLVPPHQTAEVMEQVPSALSFLRDLGLKDPEFHFTDVWSGKGEFRKLELRDRLKLFRFMAGIFKQYHFQVLVQTFNPDEAKTVLQQGTLPERLGPLKVRSHEDLALIFLLMRVRNHLQSVEGAVATACVVVDEGRLAHGKAIVHPGLAPTFVAGAVYFANSRVVYPIQLADFAAFVMNRWQLLRVKENLTDLDKTFLEIVSSVGDNFLNLKLVQVKGWPHIATLRRCD